MSKIHHVVLSGGVGSRLWPLSTESKPKQYLPLLNGESLLKKTIDRNQSLADDLTIVCNEKHKLLCEEILQDSDSIKANYIIESIPRNTAAAVAFATLASNPEDILIITPADHSITGQEQYLRKMEEGVELAKQGYLVCFGIKPTKPETGYGYIEYKENEVIQFIEKPSYVKALEYLQKGDFLWNSGIFCFKAKSLLKELKKYNPDIFNTSKQAYDLSINNRMSLQASQKIPSLSLDVAVMEQSKILKVVPCNFNWTDLGSFESLYDYLKSTHHPIDEFGNMSINAPNHTSFIGLKNCIFVYTEKATLILQKENSQEVKSIYKILSETNPELL